MRASILLGLSVCMIFTGAEAFSQAQTPQVPTSNAGTTRTRIQGIEIPAIADAPFTAKVVVTWNQPITGGGTRAHKYYTLVARDSQGRVHRETRQFVPGTSNAEPPLQSFTILDPVAGTRTVCTVSSKSCVVSAFYPRAAQNSSSTVHTASNVTRKNLGQQMIDQMPTTGTRETATGTSSPQSSAHTDTWYSADLHMPLSVTRKTTQLGKVVFNVTNLVQDEPDASWFTIPSGYTVKGAQSQGNASANPTGN